MPQNSSPHKRAICSTGQLGDHDSEALVHSVVFFYPTYGMRGRDEHHKLRLGDMVLKHGEYMECSVERETTRTRTGEMAGGIERAFKPKMNQIIAPCIISKPKSQTSSSKHSRKSLLSWNQAQASK